MTDMILYMAMASIGYFASSKLRDRKEQFKWTGKVQTLSIVALVLLMGMRMGSNDEIISNLGTIGLSALIMTVSVQAFSVIAVILSRKLMRIDRYGYVYDKGEKPVRKEPERTAGAGTAKPKLNRMTLLILCCVAVGMTLGYFAIKPLYGENIDAFAELASSLIKIGLCILIYFVGMDLGFDGTVFQSMKKAGFRVVAIPFVIFAGTIIGSIVAGLPMGLTLRESLAVGGGMGWYSLAPGIIMEAGHITASAVSFLHNVFREVFSILLAPLIADKVGHLETVAMAGSPAMDVCLPIIERATSSHVAVYSFVSGVILSFMIPFVVTIFIG